MAPPPVAPRSRRWGIRTRIVVGYVALVASALAITTLVTWRLLSAGLDRDIDEALVQEVEELRALSEGVDPATGAPFSADVRSLLDTFLRSSVPGDDEAFYSFVGDEPFLSSFNAPQELLEVAPLMERWGATTDPTRARVDTPLGPLEYLAIPLATDTDTEGVFVVGVFPAAARDEILQVVQITLLVGVAVLLLSTALAWSISSRVLRPVRQLTETARAISDTDLSRRIPVTDDDEIGELGETFNDMLDRLESGFIGQRRFLDDVAHELRTPITIVQGHVELLGDDPAERADAIEIITDELDRMNRYVSDLLLLATAEQPSFLRPEPLDLGEFVEYLRPRVAGLGERTWVVDAAPRPGTVAIVADGGRLAQAVLNLAANAVQHTSDGDELGLGADLDPAGMARIWVRDTGPGIEPELLERLFQREFRSAASRSRRSEGTGLGLAIVAAVAAGHGGTAGAENLSGGGARFTITIPTEPPPAREGSTPTKEDVP